MAAADQAGLVGEDHRLDAVAQPELGQYPADVRFDRALAEVRPLGDLRIGQAAGDQREHLALARGEHFEHAGPWAVGWPQPDEPAPKLRAHWPGPDRRPGPAPARPARRPGCTGTA